MCVSLDGHLGCPHVLATVSLSMKCVDDNKHSRAWTTWGHVQDFIHRFDGSLSAGPFSL